MAVPPERLVMKRLFEEACSKHPTWTSLPKDRQDTIIRRLERDCYNKTVDICIRDGVDRLWTEKRFRDRYSSECYRIISNLDQTSSVQSQYLVDQILEGSVDPANIAALSNFDLCPQASQVERDEIDRRRNVKVEVKVSRAYTCGKCGKCETTVREFQGRAADEGASLSIHCVGCGHTWRKS